MGSDSIVSIATRYRLDSPGIKSWWGWDFPHPSRPALHPNQRPVWWVTRSFSGVKPPRCGINNPLTSSTVVTHRVELHLYSLSGPSWPITGCNLSFFLPFYKLIEMQKHINFELFSPVRHWHHQNEWTKSHSVLLHISFIDFIQSFCQNTSIGHVNKIYRYENMCSNYIFGNILVKSILYYGCLCLNALLMLR